jgi:hypothetical protein
MDRAAVPAAIRIRDLCHAAIDGAGRDLARCHRNNSTDGWDFIGAPGLDVTSPAVDSI